MNNKTIVSFKWRKILAVITAFVFVFYWGGGEAFAASSYISGFDAAGDTSRTDSASLGADDDVTVYVDYDNGGAGQFIVVDQNQGNPVTVITSDAQTTTLGSTNTNISNNASVGGTLSVTGSSTTHGINNSGNGISNAGAVSGVSTLSTSGAATLNSASVTNNETVGGTLGVTGNTSLSTLSTSGAATLNSASITNNETVGGTLGVTGATTLGSTLGVTGATTLNDTLDVKGASTLESTLDVTGATALGDTLDVTGATTLNDTLDVKGAATLEDTLDVAGNMTASGAVNTIGTTGSANTVQGATNVIDASDSNLVRSVNSNTFQSDVNMMGNAATYASSTEAVLVDGGSGVSIKGANFSVNTDSSVATVNTIGSTNASTTVREYAGNSTVQLSQNNVLVGVNSASAGRFTANATTAAVTAGAVNTESGLSNGLTAYNSAQSASASTLDNGSVSSKAITAGASYVNRMQGDTLVDGDATINGNLLVSADGSVLQTVSGGTSNLAEGGATSSSLSIANKGEAVKHSVFNSNGEIVMTSAAASGASTSLTLTNGAGVNNGIAISEDRTVISGGTSNATLLTLNDRAATFSRYGNAVKVTGVADGVGDNDAVNVHQLKQAFSGVASVAALSAIPEPAPEKTMSVGMGVGHFRGESAMAVGLKGRVLDNLTVSAGMGYGSTDSAITSNAGLAFSW